MIEVFAVGVGCAIACYGAISLYKRDLLLVAVGVLLAVGLPVGLGAVVHLVAGVAAALVVLESVYEGRQADLFDEREAQLRTLWHRFGADARRARVALGTTVSTWRDRAAARVRDRLGTSESEG
jgi:hypothetical protein